jgi:hypothetical protein
MMTCKKSACAAALCLMMPFLVALYSAQPVMSEDVHPSIDFVFMDENPEYVTENRKMHMREDTGVSQPAPKYAGIIFQVKQSGGGEPTLHYIDERGWANAVYRDGDGNYYFMLRDDVSDEHIYMKPNGRFPYIEIGKRENAALAEDVLAHSRSITQAQLDECLEQVKQELLNPDSLTLTTSLAADEEQVRDAPRRGLVFSSQATASDHCTRVVPAKVSCYFRIEGAQSKFVAEYVSPATVRH